VQHTKIRSCGLHSYFDQIITSESSNSLKPHAAIFEFAFERTGAKAEESLMIGDSLDVDIEGANGVGMDSVHVKFKEDTGAARPTYTITSLKELESIL
jgi:putative hydrolase of the HAD superfamily